MIANPASRQPSVAWTVPALILANACLLLCAGEDWPVRTPKLPPAAGDHPRLFVRRSELADLQAKAATERGKAIVATLTPIAQNPGRTLKISASDIEVPPGLVDPPKPSVMAQAGGEAGEELEREALDTVVRAVGDDGTNFRVWHPVAWGALFLATGDRRWAWLAQRGVQQFVIENKASAIKAGVDELHFAQPASLGDLAQILLSMGLAYDASVEWWDDALAKDLARRLATYGGDGPLSVQAVVRGIPAGDPRWNGTDQGTVLGAVGLALMAVQGDLGAQQLPIGEWLDAIDQQLEAHLRLRWGDQGEWYKGISESLGPIGFALVPYLIAARDLRGVDFLTGRGAWLIRRWIFEPVATPFGAQFPWRSQIPYKKRKHTTEYIVPGTMPSLSPNGFALAGGMFSQGIAALPEHERPALAWMWQSVAGPAAPSWDTDGFGHRMILALRFWPEKTADPTSIQGFPRMVADRQKGAFLLRDRFKDAGDALVSIGLGSEPTVDGQSIGPQSIRIHYATITFDGPGMVRRARCSALAQRPDGGAVIDYGPLAGAKPTDDGQGTSGSIAVDFGGSSGARLLVIHVGPMAGIRNYVGLRPALEYTEEYDKGGWAMMHHGKIGGREAWMFLAGEGGAAPTISAAGDALKIGGQTVRLDGQRLVLER